MLHRLIVIGEAAAHISPETRAAYPEIPWRRIVAFRNFAVHTYFAVDWSIVWITATEDTPALREQVAEVLHRLGA